MSKIKKTGATVSDAGHQAKNDIVFIVALLMLILAAALALFFFRSPGDTVIVTVDGRLFGEYPLNRDRSIDIGDGDRYNLLIIENGQAYVRRASCPDGICSSHRPISYDGESIICLPNQVVIEIRAQGKDHPDIIT